MFIKVVEWKIHSMGKMVYSYKPTKVNHAFYPPIIIPRVIKTYFKVTEIWNDSVSKLKTISWQFNGYSDTMGIVVL